MPKRVRWVKATNGMGGEPVVNAPWNAASSMRRMAEDLENTDDFLAIYVNQQNDNVLYQSKICAFVKLESDAVVKTKRLVRPVYSWNRTADGKLRWDISVPVQVPCKKIPDKSINVLHKKIVSTLGPERWLSLQRALRIHPKELFAGEYEELGNILSDFVSSSWSDLENVYPPHV